MAIIKEVPNRSAILRSIEEIGADIEVLKIRNSSMEKQISDMNVSISHNKTIIKKNMERMEEYKKMLKDLDS